MAGAVIGAHSNAYADLYDGNTTEQGFVVTLEADGMVSRSPSGGGGAVVDPWAEVVVAVCDDGSSCLEQNALACAGKPADDAANRWRPLVMGAPVDPQGQEQEVSGAPIRCGNIVRLVDAGVNVAEVRARLEQLLPAAAGKTNPPVYPSTGVVESWVQLPLIMRYDGAGDLELPDAAIAGHTVAMSARAAGFSWTIEAVKLLGGATAAPQVIDTDRAGIPYSRDLACNRTECSDQYVHSANITAVGQYTVTVAVRWVGRYRIDGGAWIQIPEPVTITSAPIPLHAHERRATLISDPANAETYDQYLTRTHRDDPLWH
ncbi:MAG: hypothetical protein LBQ06_01460 [Frankiaceae bacterium]|nr:hypothetical protein [Frankiaceae bacterium]